MRHERATRYKSTKTAERANAVERTITDERATMFESTRNQERKGDMKQTIETKETKQLIQDIRDGKIPVSASDARFFVDSYYQQQDYRKAATNQIRSVEGTAEPSAMAERILQGVKTEENMLKDVLDAWTDANETGCWAKSVVGVGPVIAAGLLAHIDITQAPTVGHIWRFAGLDPTSKWDRHTKRPWNAGLKTLCWKIGESFIKTQNRDDDFYGHLYAGRKLYEQGRNEAGEVADQAKYKLAHFKIDKKTTAYKFYTKGLLPPAHIVSRARRWTVKLFLAHFHYVAYSNHYGEEPPKPYAISVLGHAHMIVPPGFERAMPPERTTASERAT